MNHTIKHQDQSYYYFDTGYSENKETLVFFHGTPSSSHEYKEVIEELSSEYRCIAIDMLGFGNSEAIGDADYSLIAQANRIKEILLKIGVNSGHIIANDFGGVISMNTLAGNWFEIKSVILFNTWLWNPLEYKEIRQISKLISGPIGKFLYYYMSFSTKVLAKKGFASRQRYAEVYPHMQRPFRKISNRKVLYKFATELTHASESYDRANQQFINIDPQRIKILWATGDKILPRKIQDDWKAKGFECFPIESGHFVGYESPKLLAKIIDKHSKDFSN